MMGVRWAGDDGKMAVDSELEEEWSRLHDMRINSNGDSAILEYTGKGKCIRYGAASCYGIGDQKFRRV